MAMELFSANGFEQTTVGEIAEAAGIGRRTFFRYFASKSDILWHDHSVRLERMSGYLQACPPEQPLFEAIRAAVVATTDFGAEDHACRLGLRIELMETVPALQSQLDARPRLVAASHRRVRRPAVGHAARGPAAAIRGLCQPRRHHGDHALVGATPAPTYSTTWTRRCASLASVSTSCTAQAQQEPTRIAP